MNDAPLQVPSAVLFLIFALLLIACMLLIRGAEVLRRSGARRMAWFPRSRASRAT
jgi:hypothetical protein